MQEVHVLINEYPSIKKLGAMVCDGVDLHVWPCWRSSLSPPI